MKTVLKVALGLILGMVVLIVGCAALIGAGVNEAQKEQDRTGITQAEFRSVSMGTSEADVKSRLGKPENRQQFENNIPELNVRDRSSCIYYGEKGVDLFAGRSYQLCFTNDNLDSKNVY